MKILLVSGAIFANLIFLLSYFIPKIEAFDSQRNARNVLFIVADDLRTSLGCYGNPLIKTPYLDRLAARSVRFNTVASQVAVCAPSRTSFLTSRRPDTTRLFSNKGAKYWRDIAGNFTTLPQHFKEAGYFTVSTGKIFHPGKASNKTDDYPYSWSVPPFHPPTQKFKNAKVCKTPDGSLHMNIVCPVDVHTQPGGTLPDIESTEHALQVMRNLSALADQGKPFFLAVGYHKPHIPLKYPREFLDLYPLEKIALAKDPFLPTAMPPVAYEPWTDMRLREDIAALHPKFPYGPLPHDYSRKIRQSYYAATSYMDSLVGKLLTGLEEFGLAENTIVIFTGDHGWSLGEHQEWAKYSNFRSTTNVPLIAYVPGLTDGHTALKGSVSYSLVELIDLFPTLAELCNLKKPVLCPEDSSKIKLCTEGLSFVPLLKNPLQEWKKAVFSQYPRPSDMPEENSCQPFPENIKIMGYSMQTAKHRYTEWIGFNITNFHANWSDVHARELYLDSHEDENLAQKSEYKQLVKELSQQLRQGWRMAFPKAIKA